LFWRFDELLNVRWHRKYAETLGTEFPSFTGMDAFQPVTLDDFEAWEDHAMHAAEGGDLPNALAYMEEAVRLVPDDACPTVGVFPRPFRNAMLTPTLVRGIPRRCRELLAEAQRKCPPAKMPRKAEGGRAVAGGEARVPGPRADGTVNGLELYLNGALTAHAPPGDRVGSNMKKRQY